MKANECFTCHKPKCDYRIYNRTICYDKYEYLHKHKTKAYIIEDKEN